MSKEREVGNHLLISKLVSLRNLNDAIQDKNTAIALRIEEKNILQITHPLERSYLILRLLVVENLLYLQSKTLAFPIRTYSKSYPPTSSHSRKTIRFQCSWCLLAVCDCIYDKNAVGKKGVNWKRSVMGNIGVAW